MLQAGRRAVCRAWRRRVVGSYCRWIGAVSGRVLRRGGPPSWQKGSDPAPCGGSSNKGRHMLVTRHRFLPAFLTSVLILGGCTDPNACAPQDGSGITEPYPKESVVQVTMRPQSPAAVFAALSFAWRKPCING